MLQTVTIVGIYGMPEIEEGNDLAKLITDAMNSQGIEVQNGDILVITQKVVSKEEGRLTDLETVIPSEFAQTFGKNFDKDPRLVEVVLKETHRIVRMDRGIIITETHHGLVCANAGVDKSNICGKTVVSLLPVDPDASAKRLRDRVYCLTGIDIPVIISDTFGRPWRNGLVNFAIGLSGMESIVSYAGLHDPYGNELKVSQLAVADELAAAAELVMGKTKGVPVVLVRGYNWIPGQGSAKDLLRPSELDMFR